MAGSAEALEDFRQKVRAWLDRMCPAEMREPILDETEMCWGGRNWTFHSEPQRLWLERMAERGWTAPTWPVEYGGAGLDTAHAEIIQQELDRIHARPPLERFPGLAMMGPALLKFGSDELKRTYLPAIARGKIRWCQGYSEPNAGSDLASLRTAAEDRGDHLVVNGQKIWTSYAHKADCIFALVRTDRTAPKHKGISFVLIDMKTPGITTKPIKLISGESSFCETFFDNVVVPKTNIVGQMNAGWEIAKYVLVNERDTFAGELSASTVPDLVEAAVKSFGLRENGELARAGTRSAIAQAEADAWALALTITRMQDEARATGQPIGARSAVLKYYGTELNKRRHELMMDVLGAAGVEWRGVVRGRDNPVQAWLRSKANSIEGGTSEIMLGIIVKNILQLPEA